MLPRFADFSQKHPEIEVQHTTFSNEDAADQPDGSFYFGQSACADTEALRMFGQDVRLVCAPGYLTKLGRPETLEDFARGTIFEHPGTPLHWAHLAAWHGKPHQQARQIIRFEYYTLVLRAAILGQGMALVPVQLIESELASGQLVNPGGLRYESSVCYWFTVPHDRKPSAALRVFREWLKQQF